VDVLPGEAHYELVTGKPLEILHHGEPIALRPGSTITVAWHAPKSPGDAIAPPQGREPFPDGVESSAKPS
jgi:hypothetical protein